MSDFDGLFILVKVSGSKSWRIKYRIHGKEKLLVFGDYPTVSLSKARELRDAARTNLADVLDLSEVKQEEKLLRAQASG